MPKLPRYDQTTGISMDNVKVQMHDTSIAFLFWHQSFNLQHVKYANYPATMDVDKN